MTRLPLHHHHPSGGHPRASCALLQTQPWLLFSTRLGPDAAPPPMHRPPLEQVSVRLGGGLAQGTSAFLSRLTLLHTCDCLAVGRATPQLTTQAPALAGARVVSALAQHQPPTAATRPDQSTAAIPPLPPRGPAPAAAPGPNSDGSGTKPSAVRQHRSPRPPGPAAAGPPAVVAPPRSPFGRKRLLPPNFHIW